MSEVQRIVLEEPLWLVFWTVPALFVLWGLWYRTRSRGAGWAGVIGLLAAVGLFVLQFAIQTDRERLEGSLQQLSAAVQRGDIAGLLGLVDREADITGVGDREEFGRRVGELLGRYTIQNNSIFDHHVEMQGDRATLTCSARCQVRTSEFTHPVRSRWRLEYARKNRHWMITDIVPVEIGGVNFRSIGEIP